MESLLTSCRGHEVRQDNNESSDDQLTPRTLNNDSPLMRAAGEGDLATVNKLLQSSNGLLKTRNRIGKTALMFAAERGHLECAEALLDEAGLTTQSGTSALMLAVRARKLSIVRLLASSEGALSGMTPLMQAVIADSVLDSQLTAYSQYLGSRDRCGMSALMYTALLSRPVHMAQILKMAADVGVAELGMTNNMQETALILATEQNCPSCVSQLLDECGKITRARRSALLIAMSLPTEECANILLSSEKEREISGVSRLMVNIRYGLCPADPQVSETGRQSATGMTAMMYAAIEHRLEWVRALKNREARLQDKKGYTALMYSVKHGHIDIVRELAEQEAQIINNSNETALLMAISQGFVDAFSVLLPYEATFSSSNCQNLVLYTVRQRPLNIDIFMSIVTYFIEKSEKAPFVPLRRPAEGFWGETALIYAAGVGDRDLVQANLTQLGQMHRGTTALLKAVEENRLDCLPLLLPELGIHVWDGQTALMRASELGRVECIKWLLAESYATTADGTSALMKAAVANNKDVVRLLLHEAGFTNSDGCTAMMLAAQRNNYEIVSLLVPYEQNLFDTKQRTALMHALLNKSTNTISILLKHEGATTKLSKLMIAVSLGSLIELTDYQSDIGQSDMYGTTALMFALMSHNYCNIELLLEHEGGMQNSNGDSALHLATQLQDVEGIRLLSRSSKELRRTNRRGDTALTYAIRNNLADSLKVLAPCLFEVTTRNGLLPIDLALETGNMSAYSVLYSLHLNKSIDFILTRKPLVLRKVEDPTELIRAVTRGDVDGARLHLNKLGCMFQGQSSLFIAAENNNVELVHLLLCESRNNNLIGETALMRAAQSGSRDSIRILAPLEQGLGGFNAAMVCAALDDLEGLKAALSNASLNVTDAIGNTALVYASSCGSLACVEHLLEREVESEKGKLTPLMAAARNNKAAVVKLLLERTRYSGRQDVLGMTALMYAVKKKASEAAELLLESEHALKNAFGETAFSIAQTLKFKLKPRHTISESAK